MSDEFTGQEIVIRFWDAVELGVGFGIGLFIASVLIVLTVGIPIGIAWAMVS